MPKPFVDEKYYTGNDNANLEQESLLSGLPTEVMQRINPSKFQLVTLYLTGGYNKTQLANILEVKPVTIHNWLMDPDVQTVIKEVQKRQLDLAQADLNNLRNKALQTMEDLLESNMDNIRFSAAKDLLDRSGLKPLQSVKVDKTVTTLEQQLTELAEFAISEEDIIDIDVDDIVDEVIEDGNN